MGRVDGKVAFITGAARGQGRSHAVRFAQEGADIIAIDICGPVESNVAPPSTPEDLAETVGQVEAAGGKIVATQVDVRDYEGLKQALDDGVAQLGHLDIVCANAGTWTYGAVHELSERAWQDTIDIVLTGVWHTAKAAVPHLIEQGNGGSIILTSSTQGLQASPHIGHYGAAKHGVVGLMRTMALELAPHRIRVNTVNPGTVNTALVQNPATYQLFGPDLQNPTQEDVVDRFRPLTAFGIPWVESEDVTNAVLFLASDEARYITGITLPVDAGALIR